MQMDIEIWAVSEMPTQKLCRILGLTTISCSCYGESQSSKRNVRGADSEHREEWPKAADVIGTKLGCTLLPLFMPVNLP
jgi:hypothetical protein